MTCEVGGNNMKELIKVSQFPVIEENLKALSQTIDEKVSRAMNLVCTIDNYKDIKAVRADLNRDFKVLEEQRKTVKSAVMQPYNEFEDTYKKYVSNKFKEADADLKRKITEVEDVLKKEKEEKAEKEFETLKADSGIDWIEYRQVGLKIALSDSDKKIKEQIEAFIEKVQSALNVISMQEYPEEMLIEYKRTFDLQYAIGNVLERKKELEKMKEKSEPEVKEKEVIEEKSIEDVLDEVVNEIENDTFNILISNLNNNEVNKIKTLLDEMKVDWRFC